MSILVVGLGRCGTNQVCHLISTAMNKPYLFEPTHHGISVNSALIIKTHIHYSENLNNRKAVFLYSNVADIFASLYAIFGDRRFFLKFNEEINVPVTKNSNRENYWIEFLNLHFSHLGAEPDHVKTFWRLSKGSQCIAFCYLAWNDKLKFKENYLSWKRSKHTLFLNFNQLLQDKSASLLALKNHLELNIPDFKISERRSDRRHLPKFLRIILFLNYCSFENGVLVR